MVISKVKEWVYVEGYNDLFPIFEDGIIRIKDSHNHRHTEFRTKEKMHLHLFGNINEDSIKRRLKIYDILEEYQNNQLKD